MLIKIVTEKSKHLFLIAVYNNGNKRTLNTMLNWIEELNKNYQNPPIILAGDLNKP